MTKYHTQPEMLDPDIRFLLANERTLLAWVRTGLTLQAGGFALTHISRISTVGKLAGVAAILFGGFVALIGYRRFKAADAAIRDHSLPKPGRGPALEVIAVAVIALVLAGIEIVDIL
jgi:putative membrane protein